MTAEAIALPAGCQAGKTTGELYCHYAIIWIPWARSARHCTLYWGRKGPRSTLARAFAICTSNAGGK